MQPVSPRRKIPVSHSKLYKSIRKQVILEPSKIILPGLEFSYFHNSAKMGTNDLILSLNLVFLRYDK
ncbi:hypothetical protein DXA95_09200 [Odoribacter sp. OF09-27XD]|nr:hypothetical protein DXA95_09200 [Odoribacter sp. OF09-27XD]HBO27653.1 hypothetical protein [Culturomica sp.]